MRNPNLHALRKMNDAENCEKLLDSPCGVMAERPIAGHGTRGFTPRAAAFGSFKARAHLIVMLVLLFVLALTIAFLAVVLHTRLARGLPPHSACAIVDATV